MSLQESSSELKTSKVLRIFLYTHQLHACTFKGAHRLDAIRQGDADLFSQTNNFEPGLFKLSRYFKALYVFYIRKRERKHSLLILLRTIHTEQN